MSDEPKTPGNEITFTVTITDEHFTTKVKYDVSDLDDDQMPFIHAYMEGMLLLMADPETIADTAVQARAMASLWADIRSSMDTDTPPTEGEVSGNVVRLH